LVEWTPGQERKSLETLVIVCGYMPKGSWWAVNTETMYCCVVPGKKVRLSELNAKCSVAKKEIQRRFGRP